jgi:hypothetical protein
LLDQKTKIKKVIIIVAAISFFVVVVMFCCDGGNSIEHADCRRPDQLPA